MRYRTRSQEVEAIKYTGDNEVEVMRFCPDASAHSGELGRKWVQVVDRYNVRSNALPGDYILKFEDGWAVTVGEWFEKSHTPVPDLVRTVEDYEGLPDMSNQDNSYSPANEEIVRSLDAIKERVECHNAAYLSENSVCLCDEVLIANVPALVAALESVLALHREETGTYHNWIGPNDPKVMLEASKDPRRSPHLYEKVTYQRCRECYNRGDCRGHFPCPTVTAIQSALGGVEK